QLLVPVGLFGVLLDDPVADLLGRVRVDPERPDAKPPADRPPLEPVGDWKAVQLVQGRHGGGHRARSSSSTTGSIRSTPSTRASRFSCPAQRSSASASPPS